MLRCSFALRLTTDPAVNYPPTDYAPRSSDKMTTVRTRMTPDARTAEILDAAVKLAKRIGFRKLTRDGVAKAAKVSTGLVSTHFGGIEKLRDEVMRVAVNDEILPIVADGLFSGNRIARRAPSALRQRAVQSLAS